MGRMEEEVLRLKAAPIFNGEMIREVKGRKSRAESNSKEEIESPLESGQEDKW